MRIICKLVTVFLCFVAQIIMVPVAAAQSAPVVPPQWQAYEIKYDNFFNSTLVALNLTPAQMATPQAACDAAYQYTLVNYYGDANAYGLSPFGLNEYPIAQTPQPAPIYGQKCQMTRPGPDNYSFYGTGWQTLVPFIIQGICADGTAAVALGTDPRCNAPVAHENQECDCIPGDTPISSPPEVAVGNPISVDSGNKTAVEVDYRSADGLLNVEREYKSKPRNPYYVRSPFEVPGFSARWHGIIPGVLHIDGANLTDLAFVAANGSVRRFSYLFGYNYYSIDQSRLKVTMVTTPTVSGAEYYAGAADTTSAGEVRLQFANGEYILFRRAGTYDATNKHRTLVPVEHGMAGGYTQWFDYPDAGFYPNRVRDSFGRQLLLTWTDLGWSHNKLSGAYKGPGQTTAPDGYTQDRGISAIALPDGTNLTYTYGATDASGYLGRLQSVVRKDAAAATLWGRTYVYEDLRFPAAITGILDQNGARLSTYAYDTEGRATLSKRAGNVQQYQVAYSAPTTDTTPQTRVVTNPLGLIQTYTYAPYAWSETTPGLDPHITPRRLVSVDTAATTTVAAATQSLAYTDKSQLTSVTDAKGNITSQVIDANNLRPSSVKNAANVTQTITWDPNIELPSRILLSGKLETNFTYNASGQLLTRSEVDRTTAGNGTTRATAYTWGTGGRLMSINGPRNPASYGGVDDITSFTYDASGNRLTMTNALGHVTTYSNYDGNGNPGLVTDPNGVSTTFAYDGLGRVKTITVKHPTTASLDAVTSLDYDVEGRIVGMTRPSTAKLNFDYDLAGRLLAVRSDDGERIDYTYDAMSNVLSETVKRTNGTQSRSISRTFDELGRMLTETLGPGRTTSWAYDKNGNPTQITTPRTNALTQAFDALDRLTTVTAPAAGTTTNTYDSQDNLASFKDAKTITTTYTRNGFGDIIKEVSPDRGTLNYTYDDGGDLKTLSDGRAQVVTFNRDILGRVTSKVPTGLTTQTITYTWDTGGLAGSYGIGRIGKIVDGSGTTTFQYDHRGNMVAQQQTVGSSAAAQLAYTYDLADRITQITYPSGRQVQYNRDTKGRVQSVRTRATSAVTTWTDLATAMTYEPFGAVTSLTLGNGLRATNDWGNDGRLASRRLQRVSTSANLSLLTYAYDNDDNITGITDGVAATQNQTYAYDAAGRVNRIDSGSGTYKRTDYTYDANGNRLTEQRRALPTDAAAAQTDTYTIATTSNRLTKVTIPAGSRTITYNAAGNTSSETRPASVTVSTTYDGYGRLTGYTRTGTSALTFAYNGRDDRVSMTSSTGTRRFVYGPDGRVMGEYGASAADVKAEFIWTQPEAANDNMFGGDDGVGGYAPLAVATPSTTGTIVLNWVHGNHLGVPLVTTDASGNAATTPNDYLAPGFPGQSKVLADLYYNRHRDYDPTIGRYIQADPIGLGAGPNPFVYVNNNPVGGYDPDGQKCRYLAESGYIWCQIRLRKPLKEFSSHEKAQIARLLKNYIRAARVAFWLEKSKYKGRIKLPNGLGSFCFESSEVRNNLFNRDFWYKPTGQISGNIAESPFDRTDLFDGMTADEYSDDQQLITFLHESIHWTTGELGARGAGAAAGSYLNSLNHRMNYDAAAKAMVDAFSH